MNGPLHAKHKGKRRLSARLKALSCTCLSAALALALGIGLYQAGPATSTGTPAGDATPIAASGAEANGDDSLALPVGDAAEPAAVEASSYAAVSQDSYAPNTLLVSIDDASDVDAVSRALEQLEGVSSASVDSSDASFGFVTVTYGGASSAGQVADQLVAQGIAAQPNFRYYALEVDDPADETILDNDSADATTTDADSGLSAQATSVDDPMAGEQWGLSAIKAYDAWDLVKCRPDNATASPVVVALIDSGCRVTHEDLRDNIVGSYDTRSGGTDVADDQNHGTHVAGIVAAKANNGKGVAGVSYNAGLYIVRALHKQSDGSFVAESSDVIKAYQNIIDNQSVNGGKSGRIRVVNMSLGSKRTGELGENDRAVMRAIEDAYLNHDLLTVSAAGNKDGNLPYKCYPCDFSDNMIGVINLEQTIDHGNVIIQRHAESNYNSGFLQTKQLSAPGTRIASASSQTDSSYVNKSGTSMASPVVAGVAALAFAANPQLTAGSVKSILCSSAIDMNTPGFDAMSGFGRVNAFAAVQLAGGKEYISGPDSVYEGGTIGLSCPTASNWKSSDESIATITQMGMVKGERAGYATITVQAGGKTLQKSVAVYDGAIAGPGTFTSGETAQYRVDSAMPGSWSFSLESNGAGASITPDGSITAEHGGQVVIVAKLDANPDVKTQRTVQIAQGAIPEPPEDTTPKVMHRLYNPNSGEHFYTADEGERDAVVAAGWNYEGTGWTAPAKSSKPVYRLYNPVAGDHHYTMDTRERNTLIGVGWKDEGIGWYSDDAETVPLYRQYNPNARTGTHNYTIDVGEHWTLVGIGWKDEGIGWYGL